MAAPRPPASRATANACRDRAVLRKYHGQAVRWTGHVASIGSLSGHRGYRICRLGRGAGPGQDGPEGARARPAEQRPAQSGRPQGRDRRGLARGRRNRWRPRSPGAAICFTSRPTTGSGCRIRQRCSASTSQGTRELMLAAQDAGVERIVYTSSVAVLGILKGGIADEETPSRAGDMIGPYKLSKFEAEAAVRELVETRGLPAVIVNPSTPIGPGDVKPTPTGKVIVQAARGRMPAFVDTGLNVAHVDDVALGHLLAARYGKIGRRYILGGENMSLAEILGRGRAGHRAPPAGAAVSASGRAAARGRRRGRRAVDQTRAVCHRGWRANGAKEDVLQLGAGDRGAGLRAAAGALRDRRCGRLVQGQRLSAMSTAAAGSSARARYGRGAVRQGTRRREFPGRLVADPPRPAGACARLLPFRAQRRRYRRQPGPVGGRENPPARQDGGDPGR